MTRPSDKFATIYDAWGEWIARVNGTPEENVDLLGNAIQAGLARRLPSGLVVDVGCGVGQSTTALLRAGYDVLGIDVSRLSLEKARDSLAAEYGDRVRFEVFDILKDEALLGKEADGVFGSMDLLAHALGDDDLRGMIDGMARLVRPGGVLTLTCEDHARAMATEPDRASAPPLLCEDSDEPFVLLRRRTWNGSPRSPRHRLQYTKLDLDGGATSIELEQRAWTVPEITEALTGAGFEAIAWHGAAETGFTHPIVIATAKPAADTHFFATGLELSGSQLTPSAETEHFQFYPEDLDENPFEETPSHSENTLQLVRKPDGGQILSRRRQITLVMLSGGIDSVYALARLLRESDDEIIAHHIHFINQEGRDRAEKIACERVVKHLRDTVRPFIYTESAIDRRRFQAFGMDDMAVAFEVGIVSNSFLIDRGHGIDRWTSGTCLEEELEYYGVNEVERFEHVLNTTAASCYPNPAPRYFQLQIIPKADQMTYMGPELVDLCWTCRAPVWKKEGPPEECGACKTCLTMKKLRSGEATYKRRPDTRPASRVLD